MKKGNEQPEEMSAQDAAKDAADVPNILRSSSERSGTEWDGETGQPTPAPEEDDMPSTSTTDIVGKKLEELRTRLQQIAQGAAEGEQLLVSLASQLDQSSAWMAELESMLDRWKSDTGSAGKAA